MPPARFELATHCLQNSCSPTELRWLNLTEKEQRPAPNLSYAVTNQFGPVRGRAETPKDTKGVKLGNGQQAVEVFGDAVPEGPLGRRRIQRPDAVLTLQRRNDFDCGAIAAAK